MSIFDGVSGKFGYPEGAFTRLSRREESPDIDPGNPIVQNIFNNSQQTVGGGGIANWIRFNAAGTKLAGQNITVSRVSEGKYLLTGSAAFATTGGFYQYGVLALPSAAAGNGGDGISPFLEFSSYDTVDTDDNTGGDSFFLSSDTSDLYVLGQQNDKVWAHDTANFTGAATQVDAEGAVSPAGDNQAGVMSVEGGILWLSGGVGTSVRAYNVNTGVFFNFSDNTDTITVFFGTDTYLLGRNTTDGEIQKYVPNFGAETLGSPTITWTGTDVDQAKGGIAIQTDDGYVWWPRDAHMARIDPVNGGAVKTYDYPTATWTVTCPLCYDRLRNRIIASGSDTGPVNGVWAYSGWTNENSSGSWGTSLTAITGTGATAIYHDVVADVFFVSNYGASLVHRFYGPTWQLIDTVSVDDQSPANSQVDVDSTTSNTVVYVTNSDGTAYGYVIGNLAGALKIVRIIYGGDPVPGFGGGTGVVSSVLLAMYEIISATQAYVYTFRSLSPPILADAEVTAAFISDSDSSGTTTITNSLSVSGQRNAILDGGFRIAELARGTTFTSAASGQKLGVNWYYGKSGAMVHDISRSTDVPSLAVAGVLHEYSLKIDCQTADSSLAASDYTYIGHKIVGDTWVNFAQRQLTLQLCIKATKTGVYCVAITNTGKDRTFIGEVTVAAVDTWEKHTVTVSASPSAGSWNYTDGIGAYVWFCLAAGTDFQTTTGWTTTSGEKFATSSQVNACDSTSNNVLITGVQLAPEETASDFEICDVADLVQRAERFAEKSFQYTAAPQTGAGENGAAVGVQVVGASAAQAMAISHKFRTRKRTTAPTLSLYNTAGSGGEIRNVSAAADCTGTTQVYCNDTGFVLSCTSPGGSAAGQRLAVHFFALDEL